MLSRLITVPDLPDFFMDEEMIKESTKPNTQGEALFILADDIEDVVMSRDNLGAGNIPAEDMVALSPSHFDEHIRNPRRKLNRVMRDLL